MIVIDTDVVSEPMRPAPARAVLDWFGEQATSVPYLGAVGEAHVAPGRAAARAHGAAVATRNAGDFEGCGIVVVGRWEGRSG